MSLSDRQQSILADMGIPVWERRTQDLTQSAKTNLSPVLPEEIVNIRSNSELIVVLETTDLKSAERNLLAAMLKANAIDPEHTDIIKMTDFSSLSADKFVDKTIWFIGVAIAFPDDGSQSDVRHIVIAGLDQMLAQPAYKAEAWHAMKQLVSHH